MSKLTNRFGRPFDLAASTIGPWDSRLTGFIQRTQAIGLNPKAAIATIGLLFIAFEGRKRMRLNGVASIDDEDPLLADYPEAQLIVRVEATEVFPNCPRYIHEYKLVARSRFVPKSECATPVPEWKQKEWANDVLAEGDPANDPEREVIARG
jgi:hypothetical protein